MPFCRSWLRAQESSFTRRTTSTSGLESPPGVVAVAGWGASRWFRSGRLAYSRHGRRSFSEPLNYIPYPAIVGIWDVGGTILQWPELTLNYKKTKTKQNETKPRQSLLEDWKTGGHLRRKFIWSIEGLCIELSDLKCCSGRILPLLWSG